MTVTVQSKNNKLTEVVAVASRPKQLLEHVGNTPLLPLHRIPASEGISPNVVIFAKAEWFNPGGSVKDRPALSMIEDAEAKRLLTPGKTILEATSGNTGIGLAMIGVSKGYKVTLVMPESVSEERKGILRAYGTEIILTDAMEGIDAAIAETERMLAEQPEKYYRPNQYDNPANWQAHYRTTGVEIWRQTGGAITHFVAGIGTSGTLMGTGRRLRDYNPAIEIYAVEPAGEMAKIAGLKHMESSRVPQIYDPAFPNAVFSAEPENAVDMARRLAQEEGLFVGMSAGAAMWATLKLARTLDEGVVVTLFPDGGGKYLSLWNR